MSVKRKLRGLIDQSAKATGVLRWFEARMRRGLTVLMYHRVLPDREALAYPLASLAMPETAFREQVRWLAEQCEVVTLDEGQRRLRADEVDGSKPLVAVTFDDGYADNARIAAPLLEEAGLRATFFVTTGFVGGRDLMWFDRAVLAIGSAAPGEVRACARRHWIDESALPAGDEVRDWLAALKKLAPSQRARLLAALPSPEDLEEARPDYAPMTVAELGELHARGHEIGAHTVNHPLLPQLTDGDLEFEIVNSRDRVREWIGREVRSFAYPNGDHDERVVEAVRRAGFECAVTTESGLNRRGEDALRIRRIDVTRDRVFDLHDDYDATAFRSELCRLRELMRAS